jgi:hypothetical protein
VINNPVTVAIEVEHPSAPFVESLGPAVPPNLGGGLTPLALAPTGTALYLDARITGGPAAYKRLNRDSVFLTEGENASFGDGDRVLAYQNGPTGIPVTMVFNDDGSFPSAQSIPAPQPSLGDLIQMGTISADGRWLPLQYVRQDNNMSQADEAFDLWLVDRESGTNGWMAAAVQFTTAPRTFPVEVVGAGTNRVFGNATDEVGGASYAMVGDPTTFAFQRTLLTLANGTGSGRILFVNAADEALVFNQGGDDNGNNYSEIALLREGTLTRVASNTYHYPTNEPYALVPTAFNDEGEFVAYETTYDDALQNYRQVDFFYETRRAVDRVPLNTLLPAGAPSGDWIARKMAGRFMLLERRNQATTDPIDLNLFYRGKTAAQILEESKP